MAWSSSTGWNGPGWGRRPKVAVSATFVSQGSHALVSATDAWAIPAGAANGDLLIIRLNNISTSATSLTLTLNSSGAMTKQATGFWTGFGWNDCIFYLPITTLDTTVTAAGAAATSAIAQMAIYRGCSSAAARGGLITSLASDSTLVYPGFAPSATTRGVVAFNQDRDSGAATYTPPAGFVARDSGTVVGAFRTSHYDQLGGYANASITFAGFVATTQQAGYLVELLL